jgi:putative ABC transport system ATP-binding protein
MNESLMVLSGISKNFGTLEVLKDIELRIHSGEFLALMGASGSGKSTLLGILGLLEQPDSGTYSFSGRDVSHLSDSEQSRLRNKAFGFVFQQFHLLPELNAWENVARPLVYAGVRLKERRDRALTLLEMLGLAARAKHRPSQLSGGEQQRVAIARALINDPEVILADEPTGNLPQRLWRDVMDLLLDQNRQGRTIVLVTHDERVAAEAHRQVHLQDGQMVFSSRLQRDGSTLKDSLLVG